MQLVFTEEGVGRRYGTSHNRGRCGRWYASVLMEWQ